MSFTGDQGALIFDVVATTFQRKELWIVA